jgi:hypothetical protein
MKEHWAAGPPAAHERPRRAIDEGVRAACPGRSALKHLTLAPLHRIEDGINAVRMVIPRCWFDATKCARGIDALKLYRADYDTALRALRPQPIHDWTSHAADAFRYLAMTLDGRVGQGGFHRRIEYAREILA